MSCKENYILFSFFLFTNVTLKSVQCRKGNFMNVALGTLFLFARNLKEYNVVPERGEESSVVIIIFFKAAKISFFCFHKTNMDFGNQFQFQSK